MDARNSPGVRSSAKREITQGDISLRGLRKAHATAAFRAGYAYWTEGNHEFARLLGRHESMVRAWLLGTKVPPTDAILALPPQGIAAALVVLAANDVELPPTPLLTGTERR